MIAYGYVNVEILAVDAFWHDRVGLVILLLIRIGDYYTTMAAYHYPCSESEAVELASFIKSDSPRPRAELN